MSLKSSDFFQKGTHKQFEFVFEKYQEALRAKAESKNSKPENILKLDKWFHNDLPKKIKSRGKDAHLTHEEIVQCMKWKLHMGVFRTKLKDLIQMNTPRVVMNLTKKAFRAISKRDDLESAINALSNLKGVGPAFASAVLAAFAPDKVPFMSDEVLLSMPDVEEVDYTMKEYNKMVEEIRKCMARLKTQGGDWTAHKIDMAIYSYYILREHKPHLLKDMPDDYEVCKGPVATNIVDENEEKENHQNGENISENGNVKDDTEKSENRKDDTEGSENGKDDTEGSENGKDDTEGSENGNDGREDSEVSEDGRETPDKPEAENGLNKLEPEKEKSPSVKRPLECDDVENEAEENEAKRAREDADADKDDQSSPHKATNHVLLAC